MRIKTNRLLLGIVLLVVFANTTARAFYDPGTQRWLNRDPLGDIASLPVIVALVSPSIELVDGDAMSEGKSFDAWIDVNGNLYAPFRNENEH